ncbi:unnamed protein product [Linum trigynum]|uniref:NAC domain-containing protein n=1 Tax=Linum trigynum TaxID=586398 RepID=A0AAV2G5Y0_9ROSI
MNPPSNLVEFAKELMPAGMKFCPTDQELIAHYLHRKITGGLTMFQTEIVKECDLYGEEEPWQIWDRFKAETVVDMEQNLYFFTRLKSKSTNGKRILRRVGKNEGTWHGEDAGSKINCWSEAEGKNVYLTGFKKRFNYRNLKSDQNGQWIMHEFSLSNTEYVICRLKNNRAVPVPSTPLLPLPPAPLQLEDVPERSNSLGVRNLDVNSSVETNQLPKDDGRKEQILAEKSDQATGRDGSQQAKESDREVDVQKQEKAAAAGSVAKTGMENGQGYENPKRIDGETDEQKKGKAAPAQAKNDGEKSPQCKGGDDFDKAKKSDHRELNEQKNKEKAASVEGNERSDGGKKEQKKKKRVGGRLLKKVDQVSEASPKAGKRPRVEEEGPGEDEATCSSKDKKARGQMDLLMEVLGIEF